MEKLQDLAMVAQLDQGRGFRMPETGIGLIDNPLQDLGFEIGSEKTEELEAKLRIGKVGPKPDAFAKVWKSFG